MATDEISKALIADIGRPNVGINYDPASHLHYGDHPSRGGPPARSGQPPARQGPDRRRRHWNSRRSAGEVNYKRSSPCSTSPGSMVPARRDGFRSSFGPPLEDVIRALAESYAYVRQFIPE